MIKGVIILHLLSGDFQAFPAGNLFPTIDICQEQGEHFGPQLLDIWNNTVDKTNAPKAMKATHFEIKCEAEV